MATGLNTTTGATVISTPLVTTTYVVIADDGNCTNVDTVTIRLAPTVAGTASTFQDTICLGKTTDLILTGSVGDVQWQSFNGTAWINETGPGATNASYTVSPEPTLPTEHIYQVAVVLPTAQTVLILLY